jgi:hypothetical protein
MADKRITIVIRPYLLRWPLREESENPIKQRREKRCDTCALAPELVQSWSLTSACESVTQVRSREEHRGHTADTHKVDGTMRLSATLSRRGSFF